MGFQFEQNNTGGASIKVIGVGNAGCNAVNMMLSANLDSVEFIVANTDHQSLENNKSSKKILLGGSLTKGLGAGARPEIGWQSANENTDEIKHYLDGTDILFIAAGMGAGTGTGAAPVIAEIAKETGILTVGVVTKPFNFEGKSRIRVAEEGLKQLKKHVDSLIVIPNEKLFSISGKTISLLQGFKIADEVLLHAIKSISDLINVPGLINLDFADVKTIMANSGMAFMGIGEASGESRAAEAAQKAISNPLLDDISIKGAKGILVNITGSKSLTFADLQEATDFIQLKAHEDANIIFGAVIDESMADNIQITVIATGFENVKAEKEAPEAKIEETPAKPAYREENQNVTKIGTIISEFGENDTYATPIFMRKQQAVDLKNNENLKYSEVWQKGHSIFMSIEDKDKRSVKLKEYLNEALRSGSDSQQIKLLNALWMLSKNIETVPEFCRLLISYLQPLAPKEKYEDLICFYGFINFCCNVTTTQEIGYIPLDLLINDSLVNNIDVLSGQIKQLINIVNLLSLKNVCGDTFYMRLKKSLKIIDEQLLLSKNNTPEEKCFYYVFCVWKKLIEQSVAIYLNNLNCEFVLSTSLFVERWNNLTIKIKGAQQGDKFKLDLPESNKYQSKLNNGEYQLNDIVTINVEIKPVQRGPLTFCIRIDNRTILFNTESILENQFNIGVPIDEEESFFGRKIILKQLVQDLISPKPINYILTGKKRIGKTSLIRAVERRLPKTAIPVNIGAEILGKSADKVCQGLASSITRGLLKSTFFDKNGIPPLNISNDDYIGSFISWLYMIHDEVMYNKISCMVLLVDEAIEIVSWDLDVQKLLRYIISEFHWLRAVIVCPSDIIYKMKESHSSTLFNIFITEKLGPLEESEVYELLTRCFNKSNISFSTAMLRWIHEYTGGAPYYVQAFGWEMSKNYFASKTNDEDQIFKESISNVMDSLSTSFPPILFNLPPEDKISIVNVSMGVEPPDVAAKRLEEADLVKKINGSWSMCSRIENEWVQKYKNQLLEDASKHLWASFGSSINLKQLKKDLKKLQKKAPLSEDLISRVKNAALAVEQGDGGKAIQCLSKVGKCVLDVATKIGSETAVTFIKNYYGIT